MDETPKKHFDYTIEVFVGAGYIILLCLSYMLCIVIYYLSFFQEGPAPTNVFAASLPPTTPTPHFPLGDRQGYEKLISDNFIDDRYQWGYQDDTSKTEVENGKLLIQSLKENTIAIAECQLCAIGDQSYFIQADLSTSLATDQGFGIVFNRLKTQNSFFFFEINTEARKYYLYHHVSDNWSLRTSRDSNLIKSFPSINTLGIFVNGNDVELYINGEIVDSYTESVRSFQLGGFGFCAGNSGFKLIVDNLIIKTSGK